MIPTGPPRPKMSGENSIGEKAEMSPFFCGYLERFRPGSLETKTEKIPRKEKSGREYERHHPKTRQLLCLGIKITKIQLLANDPQNHFHGKVRVQRHVNNLGQSKASQRDNSDSDFSVKRMDREQGRRTKDPTQGLLCRLHDQETWSWLRLLPACGPSLLPSVLHRQNSLSGLTKGHLKVDQKSSRSKERLCGGWTDRISYDPLKTDMRLKSKKGQQLASGRKDTVEALSLLRVSGRSNINI